jgi:hypothetical protein
MTNIVECPECLKRLKLDDASLGKRLRSPACQTLFIASGPEDEPPARESPRPRRRSETEEAVQEMRPAGYPRRAADDDDEEEEDRPRPRRRPRDDDSDDRLRRPRRKRRRIAYEQPTHSSTPLVFGILSCCLCCIPIAGVIFGYFARSKADEELYRLPPGRASRSAEKNLALAKTLGTVGICLSFAMFIAGVALRIATAMAERY